MKVRPNYKTIAILSLFALLFTMDNPVWGEKKPTFRQMKKRIEEERHHLAVLEEKKKSILDFVDDLDQKLNQVSLEYRRLNKKVVTLQQELQKTQVEISQNSQQVLEKRTQANRRLIAMYKMGELGTMKILFSSSSITDFLQRSHYLGIIIDQDLKLIQDYRRSLEVLYALKDKLSRDEREIRVARDEVNKSRQDLLEQKEKKEAVLAAIESEQDIRRRYIQELEQAKKELENLVTQLAQRKTETITPLPSQRVGDLGFSKHKLKLRPPAKGTLLKMFGKVQDPKHYTFAFHKGIDIGTASGAPVSSIYAGRVVYSGWFKGFGQMVILDHGGGYHTLSAYNQEVFKATGDLVKEGEIISRVPHRDEAIRPEGPSIYFEVREHGKSVDPLAWIPKKEFVR